ncbi:hypothetical protein AVEN_26013-1 [Araneus ventricosus]|uniref:Uncharacterized protein n=1 Tax=Araneus ventricosus TaxID=182803 RepID=A0A4Y2E2Y3_ARAVE|nr:hypothetical protein AVEN_26013-1 [Araneus ventricosus]
MKKYALVKAGADDALVPSAPLTYLELFSRAKSRNKTVWLIPRVHHWYQAADATKQLLLASLVDISEGTQAHGPDIALLIFGDHHQQQQQQEICVFMNTHNIT